ncbi:GntR family transcriptional regulator [Frigoribacterium sp. 2-23]|uniref:GntR family transcriptional regulator n=1 Tax=Frigoribacterium sp. 2-23 TaxID=3415006 RepID=UPI003C702482
MPIPTGPDNPAPRRLLRDVVFDKMLDAIHDGTLEPGERLNDDELVAWLGVSRTPIREAIAKLVDFGLVEMEANRYTRVTRPNFELYRHALQLIEGLNELSARWAIPLLSDDEITAFTALCDAAHASQQAHDVESLTELSALTAFLRERTGNPLLDHAEASVNARVRFMLQPVREHWQWDAMASYVDKLREAAVKRDPSLAIEAFRIFNDAASSHLDAVEFDS